MLGRPLVSREGVQEVERAASERVGEARIEDRSIAPERSTEERRLPHILIRPSKGWVKLNLGELWRYRELLYFLVWRDVKVRYKQTAIGALWAILQPVLLMILFSIIFARVSKIETNGVPYPLFAYAGLAPWLLFATSLTTSSTSLVNNKELITRVYFPRLAVPIASVFAAVVDFLIASTILIALMAYYGWAPGLAALTLPLFLLLAILTALAVGIWLSALNAEYRDIQHTTTFLALIWLIATPVAYSTVSFVPASLRWIVGLNPMAGVVEGFRWALFGGPAPGPLIFVSVGIMVVLLVTGLAYFRRMERGFADVI
jgi:lipopolysaccharide transport system permease protein